MDQWMGRRAVWLVADGISYLLIALLFCDLPNKDPGQSHTFKKCAKMAEDDLKSADLLSALNGFESNCVDISSVIMQFRYKKYSLRLPCLFAKKLLHLKSNCYKIGVSTAERLKRLRCQEALSCLCFLSALFPSLIITWPVSGAKLDSGKVGSRR